MEKTKHNPHCLILPYPIQGHINPMIQFSKRLAANGIGITFAATKDILSPTDEFPAWISVETISDGFDGGGKGDVPLSEYLEIFCRVGTETLSRLIEKLRERGNPVDCIVYDLFLTWGLAVAKDYEILGAAFFTQSSCVNAIYYSIYKGMLKIPVLEKEILSCGLPELEVRDLPSFVVDGEKHPGALELLVEQFQGVEDAEFVFVNSVYELEEEVRSSILREHLELLLYAQFQVTDWLRKFMSVKTIGPTIPSMYLDKRLPQDKNYGLSIFKPVDTCMKWLEQRSSKSVIYISFGSMATLEDQQMEELAIALKLINKPFLWVV